MTNVLRVAFRTVFLLFLSCCGPHALAATATPGCPWIQWNNTDQGIVDTHAAYFSSIMPTNVAAGTTVQIQAGYPAVRFFNFTIYHKGRMVDHLPDADLYPVEGGGPLASVAAIPYSNNYTYTYLITIVYEDAPADRAPNTLYAGSDSSQQGLLMMRIYLPNTGADQTGNTGLPDLTQVSPDGSTHRYDNVSSLLCDVIDWSTTLFQLVPYPIPYFAPSTPVFNIVPESAYNSTSASYSNFDSGYAYSAFYTSEAPLVVVRMLMPVTPTYLNPISSPDMRYFSFCQYAGWTRTIVGCLADQEITPQADGYFYIVLSNPADQPSAATPQNGYNWMTTMPANFNSNLTIRTLTMRQILTDPSFAGGFQNVYASSDPMAALGDWAPQITYCDADTFNNNALSGGAVLFSACVGARASAAQYAEQRFR